MVAYRFKAGDLVRVKIGILPKEGGTLIDRTTKPLRAIYQVVHPVPALAGNEPHYRIKEYFNQAERVVGESFLTPLGRPMQPHR